MKTNDAGLKLIMRFEGCKLAAYRCPAGILTIGYGHTRDPFTGKPDVEEGRVLRSAHEAERILELDLEVYEQAVSKLAPNLNENQFAALVSFVFNLGPASLKTSTLLKRITEGLMHVAADEFLKWDKATVNGVKVALPGLTKRRKAERELFLTPVVTA